MIFHGRINRVDEREMSDGAKLYEVRMSDVSKPFHLRTNGEFVIYLSEAKRKTLPKGDDIFDSEVTVICREMAPGQGGTIKLKGEVVAGLVPIENLNSEKLPTRPSAAKDASKG